MKKISLIAILAAFLFIAGIVGGVYHVGRQRMPLVFVDIPTSSLEWIEKIKESNTTSISVEEYGPFNWDNSDDVGQGENTTWSNIDEDPNFIVYYKKEPTGLNVQNARRVLGAANEAIGEIQTLMGWYPYPSECNGRKLAIYMATNEAEYATTINELAGTTCNSSGSIGMHVCHIGPLGSLTDGIVLHHSCFDYSLPHENWYDVVLRHEMNHFAFYSSINFGNGVSHPLWIIEGLAEYASKSRGQVQDADSIAFIKDKCDIYAEFPLEKNSAYWAGRSFYQFVKDTKGDVAVKSFITSLYENNLEESLNVPFDSDTLDLKNRWVEDMIRRSVPEDQLAALLESAVGEDMSGTLNNVLSILQGEIPEGYDLKDAATDALNVAKGVKQAKDALNPINLLEKAVDTL